MAEYLKTLTYDQTMQSQGSHKFAIEAYYKEALLRPLNEEEIRFLNSLNLFFVAFTNRCGSTFLTGLLNEAGLAVPPRAEVFNSDMVIDTSREHQIPSFTDYFLKLTRGWASQNLAGFKANGQQLAWLTDTGLLSHVKSLKIIHCKRRDLLDQAISYHIADSTGQWQSLMEAQCQPEDVQYDGTAIKALREAIISGNREIELFVSHYRLPSMDIYYEDCLTDTVNCLRRIGEYLACSERIDLHADINSIEIRKQGGPVNRNMRQRFLTEFPPDPVA